MWHGSFVTYVSGFSPVWARSMAWAVERDASTQVHEIRVVWFSFKWWADFYLASPFPLVLGCSVSSYMMEQLGCVRSSPVLSLIHTVIKLQPCDLSSVMRNELQGQLRLSNTGPKAYEPFAVFVLKYCFFRVTDPFIVYYCHYFISNHKANSLSGTGIF